MGDFCGGVGEAVEIDVEELLTDGLLVNMGDIFDVGIDELCCMGPLLFGGECIGDDRWLFRLDPALMSLASVRVSSSLSLFSSELFSVAAASIDFRCIPVFTKK
jgi:hypothetical protein